MAPATDDGRRALDAALQSTLTQLAQFTAYLSIVDAPIAEDAVTIENSPNPLRILSDSAKLLKAHTTKISLLAINTPFTPSAVSKIVEEVSATCVPAMMSAAQLCDQQKTQWGSTMRKEVGARTRRAFKEMEVLLREILSISQGNASSPRRDSLSSTGVLWESCDALIELEVLGIGGLALQKARQYRETIKDAISEFRDWVEGHDLDTEGRIDGLLDSDDEGVAGDKDSIDDIFNAANSLPADRPDLKAFADEMDSKLKKIVILYNALEKRRLGTFNLDKLESVPAESSIARLDSLISCLRRIPHQVDEMASYLYDLDEPGARGMLEICLAEARGASETMAMDWEGKEDAFTTWLDKWKGAVG